ncbi:hypothetical protein V6N11_008673 [Hibiscus sabdariffa]|uniref:Uncharacterized protein n=1 Tax=Hibiscus sabdariffa TaxID=183260 RepID=A0ABR2PP08_9ROSI
MEIQDSSELYHQEIKVVISPVNLVSAISPGNRKVKVFVPKFGDLILKYYGSRSSTSSPFSKSIRTQPVAKKGLPRMKGGCSSALLSRIRKLAEKINLSTRMRISSIFPSGCTNERSASYSSTVVGLVSPMPSFRKTDLGIILMLALGSHNIRLYLNSGFQWSRV